MGIPKKITLVVLLLIVIGSIWYLESIKVRPTTAPGGDRAINIGASPNVTSSASGGAHNSSNNASIVLSDATQTALAQIAAADKAAGDQPAIEIADPTGFINASSSFTLSSLIGSKVVLLDFWTYSCINCVRTIPYLNAWYQKYADEGLMVVGIHTPEFEFEKNLANVQNAVREYGIQYPVILDSNQGTWNAYNNLYWPHEYLIDVAGYIVHDQVGEGSYGETETDIQKLLAQRERVLDLNTVIIPTSTVDIASSNLNEIQSPETYFGAARNNLLANGTIFSNGNQTLSAPAADAIELNKLYLDGVWDFEDQYATNLGAGATITYKYDAGNVYFVAASPMGTTVDVLQDGQPISAAAAGSDVHGGKVVISGNRLYNLVKNAGGGGVHTLQLKVETSGLQAYTFTFG